MTEQKKGTEGTEPGLDAKEGNSPEFLKDAESDMPGEDEDPDERGGAEASSRSSRSRTPLLLGVLGLGILAGLGMGYADRDSQVKRAKKEAGPAFPGKGTEGAEPCKAWAETICGQMGELAYECTEARAAASTLLTDSACAKAQESVLAKIDTLKTERSQCRELTSKLCTDLGPEGKGCEFVRAKEPVFSLKACREMAQDYKQVLARVMQRQEKGTIPTPPSTRNTRNVSISRNN